MFKFLKEYGLIILLSSCISILVTAIVVGISLGGEASDRMATWLSAIGTVGAVIVSLYLANRPKRDGILKVYQLMVMIYFNRSDESIVYIKASGIFSNVGETNLLISGVELHILNEGSNITLIDKKKVEDSVLIEPGTYETETYHVDNSSRNNFNQMLHNISKEQILKEAYLIIEFVDGSKEKCKFKSVEPKYVDFE
ncbi:hypothetical protein JOC36_000784 [Weissella uvarum]|uniref:hypothetical protein n=1 Tax=Weissella uvarum TaxID=1479233 RepID=UPI00195F8B0B|nr:hypothetical protein [Weissella uvarum]MBM7617235.1 hypothetical protein [Weissella uvarum]MCM0595528.1 hypothetical protein [Weissella uvarum]